MDFFGIGAGELLLILVLALIIWGPGRLPEIARTLGKTMRTLRKATYDLTSAFTREIVNNHQPPQQRQKPAAGVSQQSSDEEGAVTKPASQQSSDEEAAGAKPAASHPKPGGEAPAK